MDMTFDNWEKYKNTLKEDKDEACNQTGGCENCVLCIESVDGSVCPFDVILNNM